MGNVAARSSMDFHNNRRSCSLLRYFVVDMTPDLLDANVSMNIENIML